MTAIECDNHDQLRVLGLRQDVVGHATLRLAGGHDAVGPFGRQLHLAVTLINKIKHLILRRH
jgi:hypothetical protein